MRASLAVAVREYNGHAIVRNLRNDLYEGETQRDCGRYAFQDSRFGFESIGLHALGSAPALPSG